MKEDAIGVGFWVDGFGTVDMYYFKDDTVVLNEKQKEYVHEQAKKAIDRLFKAIENPELIEEVKNEQNG